MEVFPTLRHPLVRALTTLVVVLSLGATWFGVLPSPAAIASWMRIGPAAERFPCEEHACGCASADECWSSCCCYGEVERLAWAIANGVEPPSWVDSSEQTWIAAANVVEPGSASCSLCVTEIESRLAEGEAANQSRADGVLPPGGCMTAADCKGLALMLALVIPPARWSEVVCSDMPEPECSDAEWTTGRDEAPESIRPEIPTPPPRGC